MRKNLKISEDVHAALKKYCEDNYLKISDWASSVLLKAIAENKHAKVNSKIKLE